MESFGGTRVRRAVPALLLVLIQAGAAAQADEAAEREAMVAEIRDMAASYAGQMLPGGMSEKVLSAMGRVPRHAFVPEDVRDAAYENRPLPIGYGQTISQPFIVALMTDLLSLPAGGRVLEIGTGSGYQAAILAELGMEVFTIEIVPGLAERAAETLERQGYGGVETRTGDGYFGWPEAAPFDAIVVTAAPSHVPPPLVEQLAAGAHMVIPVGDPFTVQHLVLVTKQEDGSVRTRQLLPVAFVPLTGDH